jgi:hypothetical protein
LEDFFLMLRDIALFERYSRGRIERAPGRVVGRRRLGELHLGVTLITLSQGDSAMQFLDAARHTEPDRQEVHDAMKVARNCLGDNGNSD